MRNAEPSFYFALPRLIVHLLGGRGLRTEMNWLEANIVGGAVHGIAYFFAAQVFLKGFSPLQQALLFFPLAGAVWLAWLVVIYLNSLGLRLLRAVGLMRGLPDDRAQSILIGLMTTIFAIALYRAGSWTGLLGGIWLAAGALNLASAFTLAILMRNGSTAT